MRMRSPEDRTAGTARRIDCRARRPSSPPCGRPSTQPIGERPASPAPGFPAMPMIQPFPVFSKVAFRSTLTPRDRRRCEGHARFRESSFDVTWSSQSRGLLFLLQPRSRAYSIDRGDVCAVNLLLTRLVRAARRDAGVASAASASPVRQASACAEVETARCPKPSRSETLRGRCMRYVALTSAVGSGGSSPLRLLVEPEGEVDLAPSSHRRSAMRASLAPRSPGS